MRQFRGWWSAAAAIGLVLAAHAGPAAGALIVAQQDDFEDGTRQGWDNGGISNPNPAANVSTGGPAGANDNYLQVSSSGSFGAGGKLVVFNGQQWAGDYGGVDAIEMDVNNLGPTALTLRLIVTGPSGALGSVTPVSVPSGSGWTTVSFPFTPANFSGGSFDSVMANVTELNLVHSPSVITARSQSPNIAAQLGVDNITAVVPEPAGAVGVVAAVAAATMSRRGRRRSTTTPREHV